MQMYSRWTRTEYVRIAVKKRAFTATVVHLVSGRISYLRMGSFDTNFSTTSPEFLIFVQISMLLVFYGRYELVQA